MLKNIATITLKYINKNHNTLDLLSDLNELLELYPSDKDEINKIIKDINKIINGKLNEEEKKLKIEEYLLKNKYYYNTAINMTPLEVATMIGSLFYLRRLPKIDQEYFNELVDACIQNDEKEYAWRLALNYNNIFDMDKIETYFINIKDSYYLSELISILDSPNYNRITTKLIESKDKELINNVISRDYIDFPDMLNEKLEEYIKD